MFNSTSDTTSENVQSIEDFKSTKTPSQNDLLRELKNDPEIRVGMEMERVRLSTARQLREWRKEADLTQDQLAEKLKTSRKQISRMESCTNTSSNISLDLISKYAFACGITLTLTGTRDTAQIRSIK